MTPVLFQASRREVRQVFILWLFLLTVAGIALWALNANAVHIIDNIAYVKAGRYSRSQVLFREAEKRATLAMKKSEELNRAADRKILSTSDADYAAATQLYTRAFAMYPGDPYGPDMRPHYERLSSLYEAGGEERKAVRTSALAFLAAGDTTNADSYASTLIIRDPSDASTWKVLAEIRLRGGKLNEAQNAISRYENTEGEVAVIHELRSGLARLKGETEPAIREMEASLNAKPDNITGRKILAEMLTTANRPADAVKILKEGQASGGAEDGNYMHRLGEALLAMDQNEEAAQALSEAAKLEPNSASVQWSLARALLRLGQMARHDEALQRALSLDKSLRNRIMEK